MIEHILLDENEQKQERARAQGASKKTWFTFILGSMILVGGCVAVVLFFFKSPTVASEASPAVLSSAEVCDACDIYPEMDNHVTCRSCRFHADESKSLKCPSGYGAMTFTSVSKGRKPTADALAFVQNSCEEQYSTFDALSGNPFSCEILLSELWGAKTPVADEANTDVEEVPEYVEENGELVLSKKWRNMIKAKWTCTKLNNEPEIEYVDAEEGSPVFLSSAQFVAEPFLANTLVKCDKRKRISSYTEMGKVCQATTDFTFTCDPAGEEARIILLKFKDKGAGQSKQIAKKQQKARAVLGTDFCATNMQDNSCTFDLSKVLLEGETAADLENSVFNVKYMCSYGKAMTESAPVVLSSAFEEPSNLLLQNALVKCGKRKQRGDYTEVGKVCNDQSFTLECNSAGTDARVIVLGFWSGKKSKEGKRTSRKRAGKATEVCQNSEKFANNVCNFNLEDVYLEGESADTFADTIFNVKYMCSFSAALPSQ